MLTTILIPFANKVYQVVSLAPNQLSLVSTPAFDCGGILGRQDQKNKPATKKNEK